MGPVMIHGNVEGAGIESGTVISNANIASVSIDGEMRGGIGDGSATIQSALDLGPVTIGADPNSLQKDLIGGAGQRSGAVISGGMLAKIDVFGSVLGGDGPASGSIETQGDGTLGNMGPVFIARSLIGSSGSTSAADSGQIFSSGKLASVVIGDTTNGDNESGNVLGGIAPGSGTISSELDMGPVKIKLSLMGGTGDESGKITSGGKITSLTVGANGLGQHSMSQRAVFEGSSGGSIIGGSGNYDTTVETTNQLGQVFAAGAIGPVIVMGNIEGNQSVPDDSNPHGSHSGEIRGASIKSVQVTGSIIGGLGADSGGVFAYSTDLGATSVGENLLAGGGDRSGFIAGEHNVASVTIGGNFEAQDTATVGSGAGNIGAGSTLGPVDVGRISGTNSPFRPGISAGDMIKSVTVHDSISFADIVAGYVNGAPTNSAAQIGTVTIGTDSGSGNMTGTDIVAGFRLDSFFTPISGSGNGFSKIASVIVKGAVVSTGIESLSFEIAAQNLVALSIGGVAIKTLHPGANNDGALQIGSTDTYYGEVTSAG